MSKDKVKTTMRSHRKLQGSRQRSKRISSSGEMIRTIEAGRISQITFRSAVNRPYADNGKGCGVSSLLSHF